MMPSQSSIDSSHPAHSERNRFASKRHRPTGGFTLIELLIVVAIIGILAAIAIPNFMQAQVRAKVAMAQSHMRTIELGLESFRVDHETYPPFWDAASVYHYIQDPPDPLWSYGFGIPPNYPRATLTTPIAYVTQESLVDPFIIDRQNKVAGAWQYGTDNAARNAWVLESVGPNGGGEWQIGDNPAFLDKPNAGGSDPFSFINLLNAQGMSATVELFQYGCGTTECPGAYDPSNGTVSDGDIVRFSGGIAF